MIVVIVVLAVVVAVVLPAIHNANVAGIKLECFTHVQAINLHTIADATDYRLPVAPEGKNRLPWDVPWALVEELQGSGYTRDFLYDPKRPQQNDDRFWNAATNKFRTIGYAVALCGPDSTVFPADQNSKIFRNGSSSDSAGSNDPEPVDRVLVANATISLSGQTNRDLAATYQWTDIPGGLPTGVHAAYGPWHGFSTPHMDKTGMLPEGGAVGMLDGHTEWRAFSNMLPRTTGADGTPIFWW